MKPLVLFLAIFTFGACVTQPPPRERQDVPPWSPGDRAPEARATPHAPDGNAIIVCGERIPVDAPVVTWKDPGGYDATSTALAFGPVEGRKPPSGLRYTPGRVAKFKNGIERTLIEPGARDLYALRDAVDLFVVHYDVAGTSRQCFKVLHDVRGLSVHFMLDLDGTIYQTMDLRDQAWHAAEFNARSVGIEIANIGAYAPAHAQVLDEWYPSDANGPYVKLPTWMGNGGIRTSDFVARPARPDRIAGEIQGDDYVQYDLTREQYASLIELTAVLCRVFPRIVPDGPRDSRGRMRTGALPGAELATYRGLIGHCHLTDRKVDPGPAFDWETYIARVQSRMRAGGVLP